MKKAVKYIIMIGMIGAFIALVISHFNEDADSVDPIEKKKKELEKLQVMYEQQKLEYDSLKVEVQKKDSLLLEKKETIVYINQKYDDQILIVSDYNVDQSIEFLSEWLSRQDSII